MNIMNILFPVPPMLDEALDFLEKRQEGNPSYRYEIIIVSDGSTDGTVKVAESYSIKYGVEKVRCLELVKNRGKGGAVRLVSIIKNIRTPHLITGVYKIFIYKDVNLVKFEQISLHFM